MSDKENKLRARYLLEVTRDVEARLAASLHQACFIDLAIEDRPVSVRPAWGYYNPELERSYTNVQDAFEASDRRMLLLGHPGAGKTTALLHVAAVLNDMAARSREAPIPFIANLSKFRLAGRAQGAWSVAREGKREAASDDLARAFESWLLGEMAAFPGLDRQTARRWLEDGRVAVLLDGLDEFNDERRADLALLLNRTFLHDYPDLPVVICSRVNEYEVLSRADATRLRLRGCVQLRPLTDEQIADYLRAAKANALLEALPDDAALRELSRTPLTLSMLVLAYGRGAPERSVTGSSLTETRFRLFKSYVERMLQRQARRDQGVPFDDIAANDVPVSLYAYEPEAMNRWLGWLAITLSVRMRTTFSPESLVRVLLSGGRPERQPYTFWVANAASGLVMALGLAIMFLPLVPPNPRDVLLALAIVAGGWLVTPWVAAGVNGRAAAIPIAIVMLVLGPALVLAVSSNLLSMLIGRDANRFLTLPLVMTVMSGVFFGSAKVIRGVQYAWFLMASIILTVLFIKFSRSSMSGGIDSTLIDVLLFSILSALSLSAIFLHIDDVFGSGLRNGILVLAGGLTLLVASIVDVALIAEINWWVIALMLAAAISFAFVLDIEEMHIAVTYVVGLSPFVILGGICAGPVGVAGAALVVGSILPFVLDGSGTKSASVMGVSRNLFGSFDKVVLGAFAWLLLATGGRAPFRRGRFLAFATDAFLLKRSGQEFEFVHRLLRDYFALREIMPRLSGGDISEIEVIKYLGFQGESAIDILIECTKSEDDEVRSVSVYSLSQIPSPESTECIKRLIFDDSPSVRISIIKAIGKLNMWGDGFISDNMAPLGDGCEVIPMVEQVLDHGDQKFVRYFLSRMGEVAVDPLLSSLAHGKKDVRIRAASYLRAFRSDKIMQALIAQLRARDPGVRMAVLRALSRYSEHADALHALRTCERDRRAEIRQLAMTIIANVHGNAAAVAAGRFDA